MLAFAAIIASVLSAVGLAPIIANLVNKHINAVNDANANCMTLLDECDVAVERALRAAVRETARLQAVAQPGGPNGAPELGINDDALIAKGKLDKRIQNLHGAHPRWKSLEKALGDFDTAIQQTDPWIDNPVTRATFDAAHAEARRASAAVHSKLVAISEERFMFRFTRSRLTRP